MPLDLSALAHRAVCGIARFWGDVAELEARRAISHRPWDHQALHWSGTGVDAVLHGSTLPHRGLALSTPRGWCACLARSAPAAGSGSAP